MNKRTKPLRSVFLDAAQRQFDSYRRYRGNSNSEYSCHNITYARLSLSLKRYSVSELMMYQKYFEPKGKEYQGWWPLLKNGKWDNESRILALLLCAEILRR